MDDSPDIFGDEQGKDGESQPSADELESAGQSALFGGDEPAEEKREQAGQPTGAGEPPEPPESKAPEPKAPEPDPPLIEAVDAQPYRVLARKYRPQTFSELIGQEAMVQTLANAIRRDRLAHAFLMTGVRGVGKTSTARLIAKALNCIGPDGQGGPTIDPCGQCEACTAIAEGRYIDVIEMDAASNTGVDDVREIIEAVRYAAVSARFKIYIIDEVHMLSRNAFNALLKTLEEPPPHVKFLFATTEVEKLPVTVLSRCQRFDLKRISTPMLAGHFSSICKQEEVEAEDEALAMIAAAAEGSVRDGLSILDQAIAHADFDSDGKVLAAHVRDMLGLADKSVQRELFSSLLEGDGASLLDKVERQFALGVEPLSLMRGLMGLAHRITVAQVSGTVADTQSSEEREALDGWAKAMKPGQLHRLWQLLLKGHDEVRSAPDPLIAAQMALLRAMHAVDMPDPGTLARKLEEMGANLAQAPAQAAGEGASGDSGSADASGANAAPLWQALVDLAERHGEIMLANTMRMQVRVIELGPEILKYSQPAGFKEDIAPVLRAGLLKVSGERWQVERSDGEGQPTLVEQDEAKKRADQQAARRAPIVEATFAAFPDAEFSGDEDSARRASGAGNWRQ